LKIKIADAHKAEKGYKKMAMWFQEAISSVNVIKKQLFTGAVGRQRKPLEKRPS